MIRASAPGKLMIAGEYSVVSPGCVALATSVSARLTVTLKIGGQGWRVSSKELNLDQVSVDHVPIVRAALDEFYDLPQGGLLEITSELGAGPQKPGLGSSAALAVATLAVLRKATGGERPSLDAVVAVHRAGQAGAGSGYDVATALHGGVCRYDTTSNQLHVTQVDWPDGLHAAILYTGRASSTTKLLSRLAEWRKSRAYEVEAHMEHLAQRAGRVAKAWQAGDVKGILDAVVDAQELLGMIDEDGILGILDGGQRELLTAIEDAGAIGRTSGAGGGDCAWALSDDPEALEDAIRSAESLGFKRLALEFPTKGLVIE